MISGTLARAMRRIGFVVALLVSCKPKDKPMPGPPSTDALAPAAASDSAISTASSDASPRSPGVDPIFAARTLLDKQVAALNKFDGDAVLATFDKSAVVIAPSARLVSEEEEGVGLAEDMTKAMGEKSLASVAASNVVVGRAAQGAWMAANFDAKYESGDPPKTIRSLQLFDGQRIVAASFGEVRAAYGRTTPDEMQSTTAAGPLSALLASPAAAAAALANDANVVVQGTVKTEYAVGPEAARKLLGTWTTRKLSIDGKPREVRTADWGFAMAMVSYPGSPATTRMAGLIIAIPDGDKWAVVALHYVPF